MKTTVSMNCCAMFSVVVLVLISIAIAYNEQVSYLDANKFYDTHRIETRSPRVYCGTALVNALALVCQHIYNKRSKAQDYYEQDNGIQTDDNDSGLKYSLTLANSMSGKDGFKYFHRNIRGVVDECCKKPCAFSTMAQYCGN